MYSEQKHLCAPGGLYRAMRIKKFRLPLGERTRRLIQKYIDGGRIRPSEWHYVFELKRRAKVLLPEIKRDVELLERFVQTKRRERR